MEEGLNSTDGAARDSTAFRAEFACLPSRGDRIELLRPRLGVRVRGKVFHVDQVQILVKWDDGRSESLRAGAQVVRIVDEH